MKVRFALAVAGAAALTVPMAATGAPGQAPFKVTGGGQVFASTALGEDGKPTTGGPGDTIAFQGFIEGDQETNSPASGQINVIDRNPGAGGKGEHFKGIVQCGFVMVADARKGGGYAELRGVSRSDPDRFFVVRIMDDGQGRDALDQVEFDLAVEDDPNTDQDERTTCGNEDDEFESALARGNAKIHKPKSSGGSSKSGQRASWTKQLTLAGLR